MALSPRERVRNTISHRESDRVPLDFGATPQSGIHASTLVKLRSALGLEEHPVKLWEPFQCLGEVELDLIQKLNVDVVGVFCPGTFLGYRNQDWKSWQLPDGTNVLVGNGFVYYVDAQGNTTIYPQGDRAASPSARMPKGGAFFDAIIRQKPLDEAALDPAEYAEEFTLFTDADLEAIQKQGEFWRHETDLAMIGVFGKAGFGDIATVPGVALKEPKGIRDPQQWMIAHMTHPDYINEIFELQCEVVIKNLELYRQALGSMVDIITISGTDLGSQMGPMLSVEMFRNLYKPHFKRVNDWVHSNTTWKTWYHCCGSIAPLMEDFIDMGVDILNPIQCSAAGMEPRMLKKRFGEQLVFWGGGVDTQNTLPFGAPEEVYQEVLERIEILFDGHTGFVFNTIHNILSNVPIENILALFRAVNDSRNLPSSF